MPTETRRGPIRVALMTGALSLLVSVPLLAGGAATLKETVYIADTANARVVVLQVTWRSAQAAKTKSLDVITGFDAPTDVAVGEGVALVVDGKFVRVIDTETNEIVDRIKTGKGTRFVAVTPDGTLAIASQGKAKLKVIDLRTGKIVKKINSRRTPWRVRIAQDGRYAAAINIDTPAVTLIDLDALLGSPRTTVTARAGRFVDGVRQIKSGVCDLSGGLDVATFGDQGVYALWSCGTSPLEETSRTRARPDTGDLQEIEFSDDTNTALTTFDVPTLDGIGDTSYNQDCTVLRSSGLPRAENGITGTDDPALESPSAEIGRRTFRTFFWNGFTGERTFLADAKMINHFSAVEGNEVFLFNPNGVDLSRVGSYVADDKAEIGGVGSSISGGRFLCPD